MWKETENQNFLFPGNHCEKKVCPDDSQPSIEEGNRRKKLSNISLKKLKTHTSLVSFTSQICLFIQMSE